MNFPDSCSINLGIVLPDHPGGGLWGPLFFAVLAKVAID
jgi:hypothetical protein